MWSGFKTRSIRSRTSGASLSHRQVTPRWPSFTRIDCRIKGPAQPDSFRRGMVMAKIFVRESAVFLG
jgi:hypothetical protein